MTGPHPMWCDKCGERFHRASTAVAHICVPNDTGLNPNEPVKVGDVEGVVLQVSRTSVQVYFRSSFRTQWLPASDVQRMA